MSTPRSRRIRARIDLSVLLIAALLACGLAQAKQTDKNQPIHINAGTFAGSQDSGKITFTGSVTMDQGSFHADGAQATGYTDPDDTSQWQRVVLTGGPSHFRQTQDNGTLVHGQAATIDYKVSENTVILTGDAKVVQEGRGEFHGNRLVYNTDSGEIQGTPAAGGRVHITLQPRSKPAPASAKPAPAGAPAATSSAPPAAPSTAAPASASTTGSH
ncbi:MAG TPA: lipopolysaccharide transport periplasmic protein LptA [Rhodanobacteraceae bacterium]|nr:lipopolysaccharide transport periplasmic protein LptA [Rhodanobacteraceae bacterium]